MQMPTLETDFLADIGPSALAPGQDTGHGMALDGTTTLPRSIVEGSGNDLSPVLDSALAIGSPMRQPILLVDDEPMLTELIAAYLEEAGYSRLITVNDAETAFDIARQRRPALILLDLMMPKVSGFEILEQLRTDPMLRYTPVIVLTAATDPATKLRALQLGASEFLAKPVDESELVIRVRNSLAIKAYQDRLASNDPVTGFLTLRVLSEKLERALATGQDPGNRVAVLNLTLDRITSLTATLGPAASEQLLAQVAARLRGCTRRTDEVHGPGPNRIVLSRADGDSFAIVIGRLDDPQFAGVIAKRIIDTLAPPFHIGAHEVVIDPSVGIALAPEDGRSAEQLLRNAASAVDLARNAGRRSLRYFCKDFNQASLDRLRLEGHLRGAIARREFALHFQPKMSSRSGRIAGAEALLRWEHPEFGWIPPDRFIPLAEETGLIVDIGLWVIDTVWAQLRRWQGTDLGHIKLAFNLSRHELAAGKAVDYIESLSRDDPLLAAQLICELTESSLIDQVAHAREQLLRLRGLGVDIAIDDFGTGFSSMSYLKHFPINELKIDRSFTSGLPTDVTDSAILQSLVVLGKTLQLRVVAEGVETRDQAAALTALGVDQLQGYLISRPLAIAAFDQMARRSESADSAELPST